MSEEEVSTDTSVENASPVVEVEAKTPESEAESTPAVSEDDEKTNRFGDRIKQLTDKVRETKLASDTRASELLAENERLKEQLSSRPKTNEPLKTLEDFEFDDGKYRVYLDERTASLAEAAASEAVQKVQTQLESSQHESQFKSRESKFEAEVKDYQKVVYEGEWPASEAMAAELRLSDVGPEMAYHLAKNTEVASEIAALSPRETIRRMALLETQLKTERSKTGESVSKAPPPVPAIPKGEGGLEKDPADMSDSEFAKWRRKQIASR